VARRTIPIAQLDAREILPNTPLRLPLAACLAFPDGSVSEDLLRAEAKRGRLAVERIGGKLYTTLADIEELRALCRSKPKAPVSGLSEAISARTDDVSPASGSSRTMEGSASALASAQLALADLRQKLRTPLPNTSSGPGPSRESATVTPLKSGSRT